ncbi:hypothetical protein [Candidatus Palauibacter sp.]|uniref:hypothetical protein n=1 Tax=Candidatus Palauibacter sp. TaxID=3101350 RepID=UPI003AF203EA
MSKPHPPVQPDEAKLLELLDAGLTFTNRTDLVRLTASTLDDPHDWPLLVVAAEVDPLMWDMAVRIVRERRRHGLAVEGPLLEWALDGFVGIRTRPCGRPGPDPLPKVARDAVIRVIVQLLCNLGHRPAHTSKPEGRSALHLVAERLNLSYLTVRRIWANRRSESR